MNFDEHGNPVETVDFDFDALDPDTLIDAKRELVTRAKIMQGLVAAREEGFRAGLDAALPEARKQVIGELIQGHREPSAALSRVAGAAFKLDLMTVRDAARWAGKSIRMIRHAAAHMAV